MGSLAFWRAMEGAGKGWGAGVMLEDRARENKLDREHSDRLAKLKLDADRTNTAETNKTRRDTTAQLAAVQVHGTNVRAESAATREAGDSSGRERA